MGKRIPETKQKISCLYRQSLELLTTSRIHQGVISWINASNTRLREIVFFAYPYDEPKLLKERRALCLESTLTMVVGSPWKSRTFHLLITGLTDLPGYLQAQLMSKSGWQRPFYIPNGVREPSQQIRSRANFPSARWTLKNDDWQSVLEVRTTLPCPSLLDRITAAIFLSPTVEENS